MRPARTSSVGGPRNRAAHTAVALALATMMIAPPLAARPGGPARIIEVPVRFEVSNVNRTNVDCPADGKTYLVRGSLVGPALALANRGGAVALYVHAFEMGQPMWRGLGLGPAYDHMRAMAQLGHVSLTIDLPGYGSSVTREGPDGFSICYGSVADIIHQIVEQLRTGSYAAGGGRRPAFDRVALVGHAGYAPAAQLAAYSFGGIDALVVMAYGGATGDPVMLGLISLEVTRGCRLEEGGSAKWDDRPGPQQGYYWHFPPDQASDYWFVDADPEVEEAWRRNMERDPCGAPQSAIRTWTIGDAAGLSRIDVPVLIALGERDAVYPPYAGVVHSRRFTGSDDVELMTFPGAGHLFHLEIKREQWTQQISAWLTARGFSSPTDGP